MSYAAMSLIAAVPAAVLVLILVMGFLQHADNMTNPLPAVAGLALLIAALVAVTPIGILLFGGSKRGRADQAAKAPAAAPADAPVAQTEPLEAVEAEEAPSAEFESADDVDSEWADSEEFASDAEGEQFEFDEEFSGEFDVDEDFEDDAKR